MSRVKEYIGCRAVECADYNGEGDDLCSIWLTDTEVMASVSPDGFCAWAERREP